MFGAVHVTVDVERTTKRITPILVDEISEFVKNENMMCGILSGVVASCLLTSMRGPMRWHEQCACDCRVALAVSVCEDRSPELAALLVLDLREVRFLCTVASPS